MKLTTQMVRVIKSTTASTNGEDWRMHRRSKRPIDRGYDSNGTDPIPIQIPWSLKWLDVYKGRTLLVTSNYQINDSRIAEKKRCFPSIRKPTDRHTDVATRCPFSHTFFSGLFGAQLLFRRSNSFDFRLLRPGSDFCGLNPTLDHLLFTWEPARQCRSIHEW